MQNFEYLGVLPSAGLLWIESTILLPEKKKTFCFRQPTILSIHSWLKRPCGCSVQQKQKQYQYFLHPAVTIEAVRRLTSTFGKFTQITFHRNSLLFVEETFHTGTLSGSFGQFSRRFQINWGRTSPLKVISLIIESGLRGYMWSRDVGVGQEKVDRLQRPTRLGRSFKFKFKVGAAATLAARVWLQKVQLQESCSRGSCERHSHRLNFPQRKPVFFCKF